MTTAEMWSFVHSQYGDELGLTSDDEDYVQPAYLRSYPEEIAGSAQGDSDEGQAGDVAPSTSRKKDKHHSTASESTGATTPTATTPLDDMENGVKAGTSSVGMIGRKAAQTLWQKTTTPPTRHSSFPAWRDKCSLTMNFAFLLIDSF